MFDERAVHYGHRYRSGFWAIYMLSAIAVLFAVMPLALGWDDRPPRTASVSRSVGSRRSGHHRHGGRDLLAGSSARLAGAMAACPHDRGIDLVSAARRAAASTSSMAGMPMLTGIRACFRSGPALHSGDEVASDLCEHESLARTLLERAWSDPQFHTGYAALDRRASSRGRRITIVVSPSNSTRCCIASTPEHWTIRVDREWAR